MSRPLRIEYPFAYYHVMNRGMSYQKIFKERLDYEGFLKLLGECHEMWGARIMGYCLMDNHYHLLLQTPEPNLSRVMRHVDGIYTQRYNRKYRRDGPLFRGRYKAIVIEADQYLLAVARYIHHNPVEAKITDTPEEYEWSSCGQYLRVLEGKKGPEWLDVKRIMDYFPKQNRKKAYVEYMRSKIEEVEKRYYANQRRLPVLGTEGFKKEIRKRLRQKEEKSYFEIPEAKSYLRPDQASCLKIVQEIYGVEEKEILRGKRGQRNESRSMAMVVCRKIGGMRHGEIAGIFGVRSYTTVSSAIDKMKKEIEKGGEIGWRYEAIRSRLQE